MMDRSKIVYRWDLDKTYLTTEFDSFSDLVRTALEEPSLKRTVPGASVLLNEIQRTRPASLHILSGSPEQMRRALEAKLRLDGVEWDVFTLKPSLRSLLRGKFYYLRDQIGYKLAALLQSRADLPRDVVEILFGDDAESDALVYSLYAGLSDHSISLDTLRQTLGVSKLPQQVQHELLESAARVQRGPRVEQIFIHLERLSAPTAFSDFGHSVCPFYNYFQPALVLAEKGALSYEAALRVANELIIEHRFSADALVATFLDLAHRGHLSAVAGEQLIESVNQQLSSTDEPIQTTLRSFGRLLSRRVKKLPPKRHAPPERAVDYPTLYTRDLKRSKRAKLRALDRRRFLYDD